MNLINSNFVYQIFMVFKKIENILKQNKKERI